jgi:hypothetical protein
MKTLLYLILGFTIGAVLALLFSIPVARAETTTIKYDGQPVPSAMAPSVTAINNDMCRTGVSGAANTGVLSVSGGITIVDSNCEVIKLARELASHGLKVAAVAMLCEDKRTWRGMEMGGSPCPIGGAIGDAARKAWYELHPDWFEELYGKNFVLVSPLPDNRNE